MNKYVLYFLLLLLCSCSKNSLTINNQHVLIKEDRLLTSESNRKNRSDSTYTSVLDSLSKHETSTKESDLNPFYVGEYSLNPKLKQVRVRKIGGKGRVGMTLSFQKVPGVNYDRTTLYIVGNYVFFKENYPVKFDRESLEILKQSNFENYLKDKNFIYNYDKKIDLSKYQSINKYIYKDKNNKLFYLNLYFFELIPIELNIDEKTITHLVNNIYYDKNGLYQFDLHRIRTDGNRSKIIQRTNSFITPLIFRNYYIFGNTVYDLKTDKKLDLEAKKILNHEIFGKASFLTDGTNFYTGNSDDFSEKNDESGYSTGYPIFQTNVNVQKIYEYPLDFQFESKDSQTIIINKAAPNYRPGIMAQIDNQNYLLTRDVKLKINSLLFYHSENDSYDTFDSIYLKVYGEEGFMQYKNVLYFKGMPVLLPDFDIENLRQIKNTNFLTDGKNILFIGNVQGYSGMKKNGLEFILFTDRIIYNSYNINVTRVDTDLLTDGKFLISNSQRIRIKDLNIYIKIIK